MGATGELGLTPSVVCMDRAASEASASTRGGADDGDGNGGGYGSVQGEEVGRAGQVLDGTTGSGHGSAARTSWNDREALPRVDLEQHRPDEGLDPNLLTLLHDEVQHLHAR